MENEANNNQWDIIEDNSSKDEFFEKYVNKKLVILLRSIYSICRQLPAFGLFNKKGYNYKLEYRLFLNKNKKEKFPDNKKINKIRLGNREINNIAFIAEYINKSDIFEQEEKFKKQTLELLINQKRRPACLSLSSELKNNFFEILNYDERSNIIKEDYFSEKKNIKDSKLNLSDSSEDILKNKRTKNSSFSGSFSKKFMKTSDTSSPSSDNSFQLEYINNSEDASIDMDTVVKKFNNLKKAIKIKTKVNIGKLIQIVLTVNN